LVRLVNMTVRLASSSVMLVSMMDSMESSHRHLDCKVVIWHLHLEIVVNNLVSP
jgi:hypothetical protein